MKHNQLLIILFLLLISVVVWIVVNVYENLNKSTISETTIQEMVPINPSFDTQVIDKLKKRVSITPDFELKGLPKPIPTKVSTSSASSKTKLQPSSKPEKIQL